MKITFLIIKSGHDRLVRMLVANGANIHLKNSEDNTARDLAQKSSNTFEIHLKTRVFINWFIYRPQTNCRIPRFETRKPTTYLKFIIFIEIQYFDANWKKTLFIHLTHSIWYEVQKTLRIDLDKLKKNKSWKISNQSFWNQ